MKFSSTTLIPTLAGAEPQCDGGAGANVVVNCP
jgi:hypothetical protein